MRGLFLQIATLGVCSSSFGDSCGVPIEAINNSVRDVVIEACVEYRVEKLERCDSSEYSKLLAGKTTVVNLFVECNSPKIGEGWVLYREANKGGYKRFARNEGSIVINE